MRCLVLFLILLLPACSWITRPMTGATLRTALDECQENDLASLVYIRTDHSVLGVRCIPKKDQVVRTIRLRPYVPMKLIRQFLNAEEAGE
ncbi:hypothetical protein [Endozoicomonas sp. YOMI1]|uniref:hypothetical protein n=1 Tax=Endozoicomonas sp. YOMI1 TaxID=2828739 RepID=UPI0021490BAD|nr:hypothetical protein [Endozoicomonas sp. YOMI1]